MRAILAAALLSLGPAATTDPASNAIAQAQPVVDRFYAAVMKCGGQHAAKPRIIVGETAGVIHFDGKDIVIYPYETMGEGLRAALAARARAAGLGLDAAGEYRSIFNELLLAHEMGHWVQQMSLVDNRWQREFNANQFMVAFWREHPQGIASEKRFADYLDFVPSPANPMPPGPGETPEHYFNLHYADLFRSPAYGWYQNISGIMAVDERPHPRFCDLVRRWSGPSIK